MSNGSDFWLGILTRGGITIAHSIIIVDNLGKGSSPQNKIRVRRDKSKDEENKQNETKSTEERSRDVQSLGTQQPLSIMLGPALGARLLGSVAASFLYRAPSCRPTKP